MKADELKKRTKKFALSVIRAVEALPNGRASNVIGNQLLRSATSVAANYRAACRAKSAADCVSKMGTVEEEADEAMFWMELLQESGLVNGKDIEELMDEADQLVAIAVASIKTARSNKPRAKRQ